MAEEVEVGRVSDYFARIGVAGIDLTGTLRVGDRIHIKGHTTDLEQVVESLQIERENVQEAGPGARIPSWSILGLGSVVIGSIEDEGCLIAGVPAKIVRPLSDEDLAMIGRKTRKDIPDALYHDVVARPRFTAALPG